MTPPPDRLESLLADLPERLAAAQQQAAEFAGRSFAAQATDGSVSATVDGSGRVVAIELSASAARQRMSNYTMGERIAEAVNRALDGAEAAREELLAAAEPAAGDDLTGAEDLFTHRMGELERTLDSVLTRLQSATERATRPLNPSG